MALTARQITDSACRSDSQGVRQTPSVSARPRSLSRPPELSRSVERVFRRAPEASARDDSLKNSRGLMLRNPSFTLWITIFKRPFVDGDSRIPASTAALVCRQGTGTGARRLISVTGRCLLPQSTSEVRVKFSADPQQHVRYCAAGAARPVQIPPGRDRHSPESCAQHLRQSDVAEPAPDRLPLPPVGPS